MTRIPSPRISLEAYANYLKGDDKELAAKREILRTVLEHAKRFSPHEQLWFVGYYAALDEGLDFASAVESADKTTPDLIQMQELDISLDIPDTFANEAF